MQSEIVTQVESHVRSLIAGQTSAREPQLKVMVTVFPDVVQTSEPAWTDEALTWAKQNATTLGLSGMAAMSLLILGSIVRKRPSRAIASSTGVSNPAFNKEIATSWTADTTPAASTLSMTENPQDRAETEADLERLHQPSVTPVKPFRADPQLRDQLAEIVRDDPYAAARILRSWIGSPN